MERDDKKTLCFLIPVLLAASTMIGCAINHIQKREKYIAAINASQRLEILDEKTEPLVTKRGIFTGFNPQISLEEKVKIVMIEESWRFREPKEGEGIASINKTLEAEIKNMETIELVDKTPAEKLDKKYLPLKLLVDDLNKIYTDNDTENMKFIRMYYAISKKINYSGERSSEHIVIPIEDITAGEKGICRDISSIFFSLFNYYRFPCYNKFATLYEKGVSNSMHTWISEKIDGCTVEFDPTNYYFFLPLNSTEEKVKSHTLKEEYMKHTPLKKTEGTSNTVQTKIIQTP